jgi:hypothetical protein
VPAQRILDEEGALVESAQAERAEVDIPFAVVDLDEPDIRRLTRACSRQAARARNSTRARPEGDAHCGSVGLCGR